MRRETAWAMSEENAPTKRGSRSGREPPPAGLDQLVADPSCVSFGIVRRKGRPDDETFTLLILVVSVPLASAKRPVPPTIVLTSVDSLPVAVIVPVPVAVVNTSSPFAATMIAGERMAERVRPVIVIDVMSLVKVKLPKWESWPLPSMVPVPVACRGSWSMCSCRSPGGRCPLSPPAPLPGLKQRPRAPSSRGK